MTNSQFSTECDVDCLMLDSIGMDGLEDELTIIKDRVDTGRLEGQLMMLHTECWMDRRRIDDDRQRVNGRSINYIRIDANRIVTTQARN